MAKITTMSLSKETKDKIALLGAKGDSFEQILLRLLECWEAQKH